MLCGIISHLAANLQIKSFFRSKLKIKTFSFIKLGRLKPLQPHCPAYSRNYLTRCNLTRNTRFVFSWLFTLLSLYIICAARCKKKHQISAPCYRASFARAAEVKNAYSFYSIHLFNCRRRLFLPHWEKIKNRSDRFQNMSELF